MQWIAASSVISVFDLAHLEVYGWSQRRNLALSAAEEQDKGIDNTTFSMCSTAGSFEFQFPPWFQTHQGNNVSSRFSSIGAAFHKPGGYRMFGRPAHGRRRGCDRYAFESQNVDSCNLVAMLPSLPRSVRDDNPPGHVEGLAPNDQKNQA